MINLTQSYHNNDFFRWDPTGRYVMTGVSWWGHKVDNAYWLWSFQGKILKRSPVDKFCQFQWRPRPPTLLSHKQIKEIKKNLKKYSAELDLMDKCKRNTLSEEALEKRRKKSEEFQTFRNRKIQEYEAQKAERVELRGGVDTDTLDAESKEMEEEVVEFLVKEEETIVD